MTTLEGPTVHLYLLTLREEGPGVRLYLLTLKREEGLCHQSVAAAI